MLSAVSSTTEKAKTHIVKHRAKYAYVAGFTTAVVLQKKIDRVSQWNAFLEEKGLTDEFYRPE